MTVESLFGLDYDPQVLWNIGHDVDDYVQWWFGEDDEHDYTVDWVRLDKAKNQGIITLVLDDPASGHGCTKEIQLLNYSYGQMMKLIVEHYKTAAELYMPHWITKDFVYFLGLEFVPNQLDKIRCRFSSRTMHPDSVYPVSYVKRDV